MTFDHSMTARRARSPVPGVLSLLGMLALAGCTAIVDAGEHRFNECEPGEKRCPCRDDGGCDEGLVCAIPDTCVDPTETSGSGPRATSEQ